jgi:3-deoxy-D-manno-octulosonic-acid transferase
LLHLYDGLVELAVWLLLAPLELLAAARGHSTPSRLLARLGRPPRCADRGERLILVHAVSVGEMAAAAALVRRWSRRHPRDRLLLTAGHRDGLAAAERLAAEVRSVVAVAPLPWDRRGAMRRWLRTVAPDLVVVIETEIWPRLFLTCREIGVPLALVSARVYPRDLPRYRRLRFFLRPVLATPVWIGVQSPAERERFLRIGAPPARLEVVGNLKYDAAAERAAAPARAPGAPVLVGASTHPGEESLLLAAANALREMGRPVHLVLAPRHPRRSRRLVRQARREGFAALTLTEAETNSSSAQVLVVDRLGALAGLLAGADIVVLGGTLVPVGGQTPLEAAAAGRAIVAGPHSDHFAAVMADLRRRGGLREIASPDELLPVLVELLARSEDRERLGARAAEAITAGSCADRYCERLEALVSGASAAVGGGEAQRVSQRRA